MTILSVAALAVSEVVLMVAHVFAKAPYETRKCEYMCHSEDISTPTVGEEPIAIKKVAAYRALPLLVPRKIA